MEIDREIIVDGVALAIERLLTTGAGAERLGELVADAVLKRLELLTPRETAGILDISTRTLEQKHVEWSLDKSVAFGVTNPRYFLSQVIDRAKAKAIKGRKPANISTMPAAQRAA
ncbi:MAG TPA: hypothetical protein VGO11_01100 [Chthoniobacteraceae bacterium]|jgi:hypothetical protein|nr:hypothetical protein [Chthoniobacteraceae bacterium]